ncbi:MAG: 5'/3'-nucleotidase SurE, partial [Candidatus Thioglobus sp.]|nr:5'/3'-nucleotidase SurE [Candidatus Thioglobus sp.]
MKILISNDDGYQAKGIQTLVQYLSEDHEVI